MRQVRSRRLAGKVHVRHSGRECVLASASRTDSERERFFQELSNPSLSVHGERDARLFVQGDDFMVEMPTHQQKWFKSVLFSKDDGKCTGKLHSDGNTAMEATFLNRVIRWDPVLGRAELEADTRHVAMVLRDLGLAIATPAVTRVAKRPNADDAALHSRNASELRLSVGTCRMLQLSGTRDEKSHNEGLRGTRTCWAPPAG